MVKKFHLKKLDPSRSLIDMGLKWIFHRVVFGYSIILETKNKLIFLVQCLEAMQHHIFNMARNCNPLLCEAP